MVQPNRPGFTRDALRTRYDVRSFSEDGWHTYAGDVTQAIIHGTLNEIIKEKFTILNAGSGIYSLNYGKKWEEYQSDLFHAPLIGRRLAVCSNVEALPFGENVFDCIVCVGEVLGYCDPAKALSEFSRVLAVNGVVIIDFGSSRSVRYRFTQTFGRAADIATDRYNDTPERIWVYSPDYIIGLIRDLGFDLYRTFGTHLLSAMGRKIGVPDRFSLGIEKLFGQHIPIKTMCDVVTIIAVRGAPLKSKP